MALNIQQLQSLVSGQSGSQNLIYNRYQRSDYTVGRDNLNPQRELNLSDTDQSIDIENLRAQLYDLYRQRLEELKTRAGTTADIASDLGIPYVDREILATPLLLQETVVASGIDYSPERDIENMLGALGGLLGADILTTDGLPFDVCAGLVDGYDQYESGASAPPPGAGDRGRGTSDDDRDRDDASAGAGAGAGGGAIGADTAASNAIADDVQCFIHEVHLLDLLLALLKFLQVVAEIQSRVLTVVFLIVRIATLVSQAWVNPSAIAEVIQELANQVVAYAIELLQTHVIQPIWDALNLDCILKNSMSAISGIMGNVGLVNDAGAQARSFIQLNNRALGELERTGEMVRDAFASRSLRDALTDIGGSLLDETGNQFADGLRAASGVQRINSARLALQQAVRTGMTSYRDITDGLVRAASATPAVISGVAQTTGALGAGAINVAQALTSDVQEIVTGTSPTAMRRQAEELEQTAARGYRIKIDDEGNEQTENLSREERLQMKEDANSLRERADAPSAALGAAMESIATAADTERDAVNEAADARRDRIDDVITSTEQFHTRTNATVTKGSQKVMTLLNEGPRRLANWFVDII